MIKKPIHACIWFALFSIILCPRGQAQPGVEDADRRGTLNKITVIDNIPYRQGESEAWRLDMALPENPNDEKLPVIVIIHGGGWRFGWKQDPIYRAMLVNYALKGYVTASVEYRLVGEGSFRNCVEDVKCAVRWLRAHADRYHINPDRIGVYGHSAGAHLALMLAMCPAEAGLEGDGGWDAYSSEVTSVIGGSTPTVWNDRIKDWGKPEWWPIGYIRKDVPPMFLIHGVEDEVVSVKDVDDFVNKMKDAGADIEYLRIDDGDHGVAYLGHLDQTDPAMEAFFDRTLKK